jgi:hypothetical protein
LAQEQSAETTPDAGGATGTKSNALNWLIGCLVCSAFGTLGLALYFQVSGIEPSLAAATWGLLVVIVLWVGLALFWGEINPPAQTEPDLSQLLRNAANVVITVDGVVLGLVYTFLGDNKKPIPLVVKVGAVALVSGVVLALLLYALVAGKITTPIAASIATGLFSLISWALAYGLLCIVFALVLPSS